MLLTDYNFCLICFQVHPTPKMKPSVYWERVCFTFDSLPGHYFCPSSKQYNLVLGAGCGMAQALLKWATAKSHYPALYEEDK